jgi:hypothetical protein
MTRQSRPLAELSDELFAAATVHQQAVLRPHAAERVLILEVLLPRLSRACSHEDLYAYGEVRLTSDRARRLLAIVSYLLWHWWQAIPKAERQAALEEVLL